MQCRGHGCERRRVCCRLSEFVRLPSLRRRQLTRLQSPNGNGVGYDLNTSLFSDYANKYRFVYVPEGAAAAYRNQEVFDFPVGTIIAKTFTIQADLRIADSRQDNH